MASVATAAAATAIIISVVENLRGDGPICIHYLHKLGEGEARDKGKRKMHYAIEGRFEEAVVAEDPASNAAKLLEVVAFGFHREASAPRWAL